MSQGASTQGQEGAGQGLPPLGPLVPVRADTKGHTHLKNWQKVSPTVLQEVMAKHPGCNVGLRLDHFIALDPDSNKAVIFLGRLEMEGKLPLTVAWRSASGRITRLYRLPPGVKVKPMRGDSNDLPLELRTGRGYQCLIPPSQAGGKRYEWAIDPWSTPVAVLPLETLRIIQGLTRPARTGKRGGGGVKPGNPRKTQESTRPGSILEGGRDNFLFHEACSKRAGGMDREAIEPYLQELNRERCFPPLEPGEVTRIAGQAAKYPDNPALNLLLRLTYDQVIAALEELEGRAKWIRRAALVKKIQQMVGKPGSIINPPPNVRTVERTLRRMRSKRLVSHRKGGWYGIPQKIKSGS